MCVTRLRARERGTARLRRYLAVLRQRGALGVDDCRNRGLRVPGEPREVEEPVCPGYLFRSCFRYRRAREPSHDFAPAPFPYTPFTEYISGAPEGQPRTSVTPESI